MTAAATAAAVENAVVSQATESSYEWHGIQKAASTASIITSNAVPHDTNTNQDGIPDAGMLRSDESHLKKSVGHPATRFEYIYMWVPTHVHMYCLCSFK